MHKYESEAARVELAKTIAQESYVLLKNEGGMLPLAPGRAAFFGRACYRPVLGGMGSGTSTAGLDIRPVTEACEKMGITQVEKIHTFYEEQFRREDSVHEELPADSFEGLVASGYMYEIFGRYAGQPEEPELPEALFREAASETDTAILFFNRQTGGEECDRHLKNDYYLLDSEKKLIESVCSHFPRVAVVLNVNGVADFSWTKQYESIKSVLYIGAPGQEGAAALADILVGKVSPSGKLAFTVAEDYFDYPTAKDFSFDKDNPENILEYKDYGLSAADNHSVGFEKSPVTVYREGIYVGYKYFDTFHKPVLYPFGYGLSYADFALSGMDLERKGDQLCISGSVKNMSTQHAGKEVVQVYVSKPSVKLDQAYQNYMGCVKTKCLKPLETESVEIVLNLQELASYSEQDAAWVLESGDYVIRVGNSSRNTEIAGRLRVENTITLKKVKNVLPMNPKNRIDFLKAETQKESTDSEDVKTVCVSAEDFGEYYYRLQNRKAGQEAVGKLSFTEAGSGSAGEHAEAGLYTLADVAAGKMTMSQFLAQLTAEELAVLANGYGTGLPFGGIGSDLPKTWNYEDGTAIACNTHKSGSLGYVSPAITKYGIPSVYYKDGPVGVGKVAWPTAMIMACSFHAQLFYDFGMACGREALELGVDSWLAPALNLQRNPLGGRNFEYFSEDPVAAGICGLNICRGAARNPGLTACPKHFAINEQETYRRGSKKLWFDAVDSIVSERVAREVYLKPFEMVITDGCVKTLMTSFNKINGVFAAGNYGLCTEILRDEWNYDGVVVTDWGDMDIVVDGADAVAAGNDVVMPGGPPVIRQVLEGYARHTVTREELETAVGHLLEFVKASASFTAYTECSDKAQV